MLADKLPVREISTYLCPCCHGKKFLVLRETLIHAGKRVWNTGICAGMGTVVLNNKILIRLLKGSLLVF